MPIADIFEIYKYIYIYCHIKATCILYATYYELKQVIVIYNGLNWIFHKYYVISYSTKL